MRVYSLSYWLVFFVQPIAADCWRGRGSKLARIHEKKPQFLMNTQYIYIEVGDTIPLIAAIPKQAI